MRRTFVVVLVAVLLFHVCSTAVATNTDVPIIMNGSELSTIRGTIVEGRTFVPMRSISEVFGAVVQWNPDYRQVSVEHEGESLVCQIGSTVCHYNGIPIRTVAPFINSSNRTMIPFRIILEFLDKRVWWDDATRSVHVRTDQQSIPSDLDTLIDTQVEVEEGYGYRLVSPDDGWDLTLASVRELVANIRVTNRTLSHVAWELYGRSPRSPSPDDPDQPEMSPWYVFIPPVSDDHLRRYFPRPQHPSTPPTEGFRIENAWYNSATSEHYLILENGASVSLTPTRATLWLNELQLRPLLNDLLQSDYDRELGENITLLGGSLVIDAAALTNTMTPAARFIAGVTSAVIKVGVVLRAASSTLAPITRHPYPRNQLAAGIHRFRFH